MLPLPRLLIFLPLSLALAALATSGVASAERPRGGYVWREAPAQAAGEEPPRILYLNRCKGGCALSPGAENAINNTSSIVKSTVTLAEFPFGDAVWDEVLACVKDQYYRYNINVTDVDPGDALHFESIVAGNAADIGAFGAGGIAPFSCSVYPNTINFTFAETLGGNAQLLCEVIAQESGHVMGMEHAFLCQDPMTYLDGCGPKKFQDVDAPCGEFSEASCTCGNATQNSHRHLLNILGPGNQEATANLAIGEIREDPDNADGNGIAEPGEKLLIDVAVSNNGNNAFTALQLKLKAGGQLKLDSAPELDLEGGQSKTIQLVAKVEDSACGERVTFDVTASLEDNAWSASGTVIAGIAPSSHTEVFAASNAPWTPAEADAPAQGGWEYGAPMPTFFAGRTLQPDGASAGPGSLAWMTALDGAWNESTVVGTTTLVSSILDLGSWHSISGIQYNLWYQALDRSSSSLQPSPDVHLIVELSRDNGKSWTQIDSVAGESYRWETREASFEPINASAKTKLRFTVSNDGTVDDRLIEVGIDSVTIIGGELLCTPTSGGCGCATSNTETRDLWPLMVVGVLLFWRRRRTLHAC